MKVILVAALSADGFIGRTADHHADWTGSADKKLFVKLTKEAGVMVMGRATFNTIGRALPERRTIVYTRQPNSITVPGIDTTQLEPAELLRQLKDDGYTRVAICGGSQIYGLFMKAGLVTDLYLTYTPIVFGRGIPLFDQPLAARLKLINTQDLGEEAVLHHYELQS
nr:dihydrofolate reductase [uncultured bacterium]AIA10878.1 dihydrofolate reductase [uncultured bacterium]